MKNEILTLKEIQDLDNINEVATKEYVRLAEENLRDCLDTKKQLEQKSCMLFIGYSILTLVFFVLPFNIISIIITIILFIGMISLILSINCHKYGCLGWHPTAFLTKSHSYLTIESSAMAAMYAYTLHSYMKKVIVSDASNNIKIRYIQIAIFCGIISLLLFLLKIFFSYGIFYG